MKGIIRLKINKGRKNVAGFPNLFKMDLNREYSFAFNEYLLNKTDKSHLKNKPVKKAIAVIIRFQTIGASCSNCFNILLNIRCLFTFLFEFLNMPLFFTKNKP
jgi:hypothetical protein